MRHVRVQAPAGRGEAVVGAARQASAALVAKWSATDSDGHAIEVVDAYLPNRQVEDFLGALDDLAGRPVVISPRGDLVLGGPAAEVAGSLQRVTLRSPIEILLGGLQSIGSWRGFLAYAAAAGVVVWLGLATDTGYLLVAAMLIAPFAGPAMNVAIATARGDLTLLWRSLLRYFAALATTIVVAGFLSLLFGHDLATSSMFGVANVSAMAALLPLAAGAAGALNLIQSERSSLVSGAAVGMLVAASLAPPAGLVGMATVIGRFDMALSGLFLLALQLAGINLAGAFVFRMAGMTATGARYARGRSAVTALAAIGTGLALALIVAIQFGSPSPELQRKTVEQDARSIVRSTLEERHPEVRAVDIQASFTRPDVGDQNTLLLVVFLQTDVELGTQDSASLAAELRSLLGEALRKRLPSVTPLISIELLAPAGGYWGSRTIC